MSQPAADTTRRRAPRASSARAVGRCSSRSTPRSRSLKLYPVENATVQKALDDLDATAAAPLLAIEAELEVRLAGDFIFVNATRLRLELDNYASFSHILAVLRAFDDRRAAVHCDGRTARVADPSSACCSSLAERGQPDERFEELDERLAGGQVRGLGIERCTPTEERRPTPSRPRRRPSGSIPRASRSPRTSSPACGWAARPA